MKWEVSLWNYHKIGLIVALFVFILLCPPILPYVQRNTRSWFFTALFYALVVWSFLFIMLHVYSSKNQHTMEDDL